MHFPYCKSKCAYCNFVSHTDFSTQGKYVSRLIEEICATESRPKADTVYFGGGTPSTMPRGTVTTVFETLKRTFDLSELVEFTVEANPDSVTSEFVAECKACGVNRISVGLQSSSDAILKKIGRIHSVDRFIEAVRTVTSGGIDNVSSDLILGLPSQTKADIDAAIKLFDELGISHVSVYALTVEEGTPLSESGYVVDPDLQADMYEYAVLTLKKYGYIRYEVSNFARADRFARHNYKYWIGADYYGFGVAAHSLIKNTRYANTDDIHEYLGGAAPTVQTLSIEDARTEFIMLRLRTYDGLDLDEYAQRFGSRLEQIRSAEIARLIELGVITVEQKTLRATDKGTYLLDAIITELL